MSPSRPHHFDVAIIGYGPVGGLTALQLAAAGLEVAILERETDIVQLPRAVGLDGESMRAFQALGFAEAVEKILQPPRAGERISFTDADRNEIFGMEAPGLGVNGWRDLSFFDQPELEAVLRQQIASNSRIQVLQGHQVEALDQDAERVTLQSRELETGKRTEHTASFVIGSDGASSFVREALGIDWNSLGYDQDWLVIDIIIQPGAELPLSTLQVCDPKRLTSYICVKDPNRRWEFQLLPGETREQMLLPETIDGLLASWLPADQYELRRAAVYQFHAATAGSWREGRILLAGDAAHQTPPFLGQGLNAGFRDATNLGWKIPRVLSGACDARLLDTYAEDREPHAVDLVERAVGVGQLMEFLAKRDEANPPPPPKNPGEGLSANPSDQGLSPRLRSGLLIEAQASDNGPAGRNFRQPRLRTPAGEEHRLDTLLGRGFAVVALRDSDLVLGAEAKDQLERLGGKALSLEGHEVVEGRLDPHFEKHPVLLVRPDRILFGGSGSEWSVDQLIAEAARQAHLV